MEGVSFQSVSIRLTVDLSPARALDTRFELATDVLLFFVIFSFSVIDFSTPRGHARTPETLHTFNKERIALIQDIGI